jgi:hypothetical protein
MLFKRILNLSYDSKKRERFLSHGANRAEREVFTSLGVPPMSRGPHEKCSHLLLSGYLDEFEIIAQCWSKIIQQVINFS